MAAVIAMMLAVLWLRSGIVTITFEGVPADLTDVRAFEWRDDGLPVEIEVSIERFGERVVISTTSHASVVTVFSNSVGTYAIDGPAAWTTRTVRPAVETTRRHTERGVLPAGMANGPHVRWIGVDPRDGPWPRCGRGERLWECWGVAPSDGGVVVIDAADRIWWTGPFPGAGGPLRSAAWGRLVIVRDSSNRPTRLAVSIARPVTPSSARFAAIRLESTPVGDAGATQIVPGAVWIHGERVPPKAWVEIRSGIGGPAYLALDDLAAGLAAVPVTVSLTDTRTITGVVTGQGGRLASNALVTLFRLIDPPPTAGSKSVPRRVFGAEASADDKGEFSLEGVGEAEYEIVAWHPQLGRAAIPLDGGGDRVDVRLSAGALARGRVISGGRPLAGVAIVSVPDPAMFSEVRDMTEVKGGDARSGPDGRFTVMLAGSGGGELRIGGGSYSVTRVPLPRVPASVDLGDVELASPIEVEITVEGDPGCALQAIGPIGRMGLQLVHPVRRGNRHHLSLPEPGLWQFGLLCVGERRALSPDSVAVTPALAGKELHFTVR